MPERTSEGRKSIKVEIYDQQYTLGGDTDPEYVRRLAERVDATMRQVAKETRLVDSVRVAVLAAVNLADEIERLQQRVEELEHLESRVSSRARALSRDLDQVLARRLGQAG